MDESWDSDENDSQPSVNPAQKSASSSFKQDYGSKNSNDFKNYQQNDGRSNDYSQNSWRNNDRQNRGQNSRGNSRNDYQNRNNDYQNRRNDGYQNQNRRNDGYQNRDQNAWESNRYENDDEKLKIFVPTAQLGKIIGRKGAKIREIQDNSQTKININHNNVQGDSTEIEIVGSKTAQDSAKSIIDELTGDSYDVQEKNSQVQKQSVLAQSSQDSEDKYQPIDWGAINKEFEEAQKVKWGAYPPVIKNFYHEHPEVSCLSKLQVEQIRFEQNEINVGLAFDETETIPDNYIPNPITKFEHAFQQYPEIMHEIHKNQFVTPSPIQCQAWPILMSGKDLIGIAQTGTGKTLAFLLPALIHIDGQTTPRNKRSGPTVMIMAPTRELALQIEREVNKYNYKGIKALCIYGGGDRKEQMKVAKGGVEIVIATPGRLNDLVQAEAIDVDCVSYLVLDEADRMLDMGFEPQIRKTLLDIRPDRQTVMTSATWPPGVRRLASSYMENPITVCVGTMDLKACHSVTQKVYIIEEEEKRQVLEDFFNNMGPDDKVMVFIGKKDSVDNIGSELALKGVRCQSIHGGREQSDREGALEDFKIGVTNILLATDVASRGIDIEDVTHVINYDFPRDIEEYVHRVGRTGRAGRTGVSISLMTRRDWGQASHLIKILEEANQEIPEELYSMAERYEVMKKKRAEEDRGGNRRGRGGRGGNRGGNRYRN